MFKDYTTMNTEATGINAIKQSIKNILLTPRGSLPGKPNFGSDLYNIVFHPLDALTESMGKRYIEEALSEFEDRIIVREVSLKREEAYNKLIINISFIYQDVNISSSEAEASSISISINV